MKIRKIITLSLLFVAAILVAMLYLYNQIYLSRGQSLESKILIIGNGQNALEVAEKMQHEQLIAGKYYLAFYLWKNGELHDLVAGSYEIKPGLTIPEIAHMITTGEVAQTSISITFPEGWTASDMAKRLTANGLAGEDFLAVVNKPPKEVRDKYLFLGNSEESLEGYLFPDTYQFSREATAQEIVEKMLKNFSLKLSEEMRKEIASQKKDLREIIIMASIIEKEAKFASEMTIVSSVFWNRMAIGQRLQSDATLEYVLRDNKIQHSAEDLQNTSPYNTYQFAGLPPGPVSNPGMDAILAAIHPDSTEYFYFLTDLKTKKTIFSKTFEEHVQNKSKYGL